MEYEIQLTTGNGTWESHYAKLYIVVCCGNKDPRYDLREITYSNTILPRWGYKIATDIDISAETLLRLGLAYEPAESPNDKKITIDKFIIIPVYETKVSKRIALTRFFCSSHSVIEPGNDYEIVPCHFNCGRS